MLHEMKYCDTVFAFTHFFGIVGTASSSYARFSWTQPIMIGLFRPSFLIGISLFVVRTDILSSSVIVVVGLIIRVGDGWCCGLWSSDVPGTAVTAAAAAELAAAGSSCQQLMGCQLSHHWSGFTRSLIMREAGLDDAWETRFDLSLRCTLLLLSLVMRHKTLYFTHSKLGRVDSKCDMERSGQNITN